MKMKVLSVDFQKDFSNSDGRCYRNRPCVAFLQEILFPYLRSKNISVAEIVSDYRLPRPGDENECCIPGSFGYESDVPSDIKSSETWIKCMNSPEWTRDNAGKQGSSPGLPRPDPQAFSSWLTQTLGPPGSSVVLVGLTLDCCVLATAISLAHRAYKVSYLNEGVDCYSGSADEKKFLLNSAAANWGNVLTWHDFQGRTTSSTLVGS